MEVHYIIGQLIILGFYDVCILISIFSAIFRFIISS